MALSKGFALDVPQLIRFVFLGNLVNFITVTTVLFFSLRYMDFYLQQQVLFRENDLLGQVRRGCLRLSRNLNPEWPRWERTACLTSRNSRSD